MANKLVIANGKKKDIIEGGRAYLNSLDMRLFVADITPTGTTQPAYPGDECADGGYSPVANPYPNAFATLGTVGAATGVNITWIFTHSGGDFTAYGIFFTDPADGGVTVMSQRDDAPFTVTAAGQVYVATAYFELDTEP
ncbi:MAG TPA: hypothetical protein VH092_38355 [Urbifossiella sp.]|jgi:hypothetical protein|nr:hypothetical protein [Urbifossiella sp.]